jgi:hypothetical protein
VQTATNPQTGEKIMWNGSAWVPAGSGAPVPQSGLPRVIQGPPKEPPPQTPAQIEGDALGNEQKRRELNKPSFVPQGSTQMLTPDGKVVPIPGANEAKQQQNAASLLKAAGVDLERGIDPVSDLIKNSTSGAVEHLGAQAVGAFGHATPGMENIGKLKTIVSDMVLQLTGGGLGNQVSDADRQFIIERVGDLANPDVPADQRLAAWEAVKQRMANVLGVQPHLSDDQVVSELQARVRRGDDPSDTIHWLVSTGRQPTKEQIAQIIAGTGRGDTIVDPPSGPDGGGGGLSDLGHAFGVGVRGVVQGAGDLANAVSSPFIGAVNYATGSNFNTDMGANVGDTLGLPTPQNDAERTAFTVNRFGTAALGGAAGARAAAPLAGDIIGGALQRFGSAPLTDAFAGSSGGAASDAARRMGAGPVGQTAAGVLGGALSLPVAARGGNTINALLNGPEPLPSIVQAGQREGVTVNRAMVDPSRQQKVTAVGKTMVGGRMMQRDMGKVGDQIQGRVGALGAGGEAMEPQVAGETLRGAAERSIKQSGQQLGRRYDRLEKATEGLKVPPKESLAKVDEVINRLSEMKNSNAPEISYLQNLRKDLSSDLSVGALRRLRTKLRKSISKGDLTFGEDEADVLSIMDSASNDIANGLQAAGKGGVAREFKAVDQAYRDRMGFITGTVQKIVGKRNANLSGEQVFANMRALTSSRGDAGGFARMMREMTPEEQQDIAATFAEGLGKNPDGSFSTATLVKHIEKLPPATRAAMFGPDGAKSLQNLSELARAHKRVMHSLGGSPTGVASDYKGFVMNLLLGGGGTLAAGGGGVKAAAVAGGLTAAKVGRDVLNARLLMSPKIQGWLRSAPRTADPAAINAHFDRLKAIAVREPALAPQIQQLEDMILKAANDTGTTRAVASEGGEQNN